MAPWSEIAGDFDLDFGKVVAKPVSGRRVKSRGVVENFRNKFLRIRTIDVTKTVAFPITVGQPGVKRNIVDNQE